jgi:hypothetical protein
MNKSGVCSVTTDGSLLGGQGKDKGVEVITNGRRVNYFEFYAMAKGIIDRAAQKGAFVDERCSTHMHVLTGYLKSKRDEHPAVNELERSIPEAIALNLHQLLRVYQNPITWMTSGLDNPDGLTRWEKYRVSILDVDAQKPMYEISESIAGKCCKSKYGWANWVNTKYDDDGDIETLHVEIRVADGLMSPSAVAAIACLYYAIAIKAAEISKFGVLALNDIGWHERAARIKNALLNGNGGWEDSRTSDTSELEKHYPELQAQSLRMLYQLKNILVRLGPAYDVLEKLAVGPCSIRRCSGKSWNEIEAELAFPSSEENALETAIVEVLHLVQISGMESQTEWIEAAAERLSADSMELLDYIESKKSKGEVVWSEKVGAPLLIKQQWREK